MLPTEIVRSELIVRLGRHGVTVTSDQLDRWYKRSLIPSPRSRSKGRGKGSESVFPILAFPQAYAIALLLEIFPRDLDSIGWCLFCCGFPVVEVARESLMKELTKWKDHLRSGLEAFDDDAEEENPISALTRGRVPPEFGRIRRRVGKARVETVAALAYQVLLGEFDQHGTYDEQDWKIVRDAIDAQLGISRRDGSALDAVSAVPDALELLSSELNLPLIQKALEDAPPRMLCLLRDESQTLYRHSGLFPGIEQSLVPREIFLLWFAFRCVSPTSQKAIADFKDKDKIWGKPEQSMVDRVARAQHEASSRKKKPAAKKRRRGKRDQRSRRRNAN